MPTDREIDDILKSLDKISKGELPVDPEAPEPEGIPAEPCASAGHDGHLSPADATRLESELAFRFIKPQPEEEPEEEEDLPRKKGFFRPITILAVVAIIVLAAAAGVYFVWHSLIGGLSASDVSLVPISMATAAPTVRVTIPEGYSVDQIAALLDKNGVCSADSFYRAVQYGDFPDYPFVAQIDMTGRAYRLEGYLFPDTYDFYMNISGQQAVTKLLANFQSRTAALRGRIAASGLTLDQTVILASVIQREVIGTSDMAGVSRVLLNRLENPGEYPKLQCDSTGKYVSEFNAGNGVAVIAPENYNTYQCSGLPAGAIGNPGLEALTAAVSPSEDPAVAGCYYFATDSDGVAHFSKTYAEHVAVCKKYGIGIYA